jgi:hypothetical protein
MALRVLASMSNFNLRYGTITVNFKIRFHGSRAKVHATIFRFASATTTSSESGMPLETYRIDYYLKLHDQGVAPANETGPGGCTGTVGSY